MTTKMPATPPITPEMIMTVAKRIASGIREDSPMHKRIEDIIRRVEEIRRAQYKRIARKQGLSHGQTKKDR
jgi:hypothetical protein